MNEDNLKIKVEGFSRMPEGDKKNKVVEQINYLCQELIFIPIRIPPFIKNWQYL
jgi:hypothetical protein